MALFRVEITTVFLTSKEFPVLRRRPIGLWLKRSCILFAVCAAFQARAEADSLLFIKIVNPGESATVNGESTVASPLQFTYSQTGLPSQTITAFCVDINHNITLGPPPSSYSVAPGESTPTGLAKLTLNSFTGPTAISSTLAQEVAGIAFIGLNTTDTSMAAGAQLAIWDLLFSTPTNPNFAEATGSDATKANADRDSLLANALSTKRTDAIWLDSGTGSGAGQSMIYFPSSTPNESTPEPTSAVIMAIFAGSFCLGGIRRRFGRSVQE